MYENYPGRVSTFSGMSHLPTILRIFAGIRIECTAICRKEKEIEEIEITGRLFDQLLLGE